MNRSRIFEECNNLHESERGLNNKDGVGRSANFTQRSQA